MTTIIILNAILGATVFATALAIVGWAIKTQHRRDYVPVVLPGRVSKSAYTETKSSRATVQVAPTGIFSH